MKKHFLLIVPFVSLFTVAFAQIPNPSFENWTSGEPNNWYTGNTPFSTFTTENNNAHAGSSAAKSSVVSFMGFTFSFPLSLGSTGSGVFTSTAPEAIHGWYIANLDSGDYAVALIGMKQDTSYTGAGTASFTNTAVYKEFIANVYYLSGTPNGDSLAIFFPIFPDSVSGNWHPGSYIIVDDLSFGPATSVSDVSSGSLPGLETVSPNPAGNEAQIIYNIRESGKTELSIYDLNGRMVKSVVNEEQTPGRYKALSDLTDLPPGTYICRLMNGSVADFQKVMVQR